MKPLRAPHNALIHSGSLCNIPVHVKYQFNSICKYDFPSIQERERQELQALKNYKLVTYNFL